VSTPVEPRVLAHVIPVCIARQVYRPLEEIVTPVAVSPARPTKIAKPRKSAGGPPHTVNGITATPLTREAPKFEIEPLTGWYIGPWPLDVGQPLRVRPQLRDIPGQPKFTEGDIEGSTTTIQSSAMPVKTHTGVIILTQEPPSPLLHIPLGSDLHTHKMLVTGDHDISTPKLKKAKRPRVSKTTLAEDNEVVGPYLGLETGENGSEMGSTSSIHVANVNGKGGANGRFSESGDGDIDMAVYGITVERA
jgi:hypothetical protein